MGEVSGAKMATALELAAEDNRNGIPTQAVLCLKKPAAVRLQSQPPGLAAIADIHAAIVDLRRYTPGSRHHRRHRRLLWRYVYRRRAVPLSHCHS